MIGLLMLAAAVAPTDAATRADLICAESAVFTLHGMGDAQDVAHFKVLEVAAFYFGSLTGRDPAIDWMAAVNAEMAASHRSKAYYDRALKRCASRMTKRMRVKS